MTVPVHGDGRALDARLRSAGPGSSPGARMVERETFVQNAAGCKDVTERFPDPEMPR